VNRKQGIYREQPTRKRIDQLGGTAVDMHFHTNHSDSPTTVKRVLSRAQRLRIGVSITDHNSISGVEEAFQRKSGALVIPGIEVSAIDGPHILLYFYDLKDLQDYYRFHVRPFKGKSPYLAIDLDSWDIVGRAAEYSCVKVAAHPYGYLMFNKGLQKCIEAHYLEQEILELFDGVEVLSGGMSRSLNDKAAVLAERFSKGRTGGTDGHLLIDLGQVLTVGPSNDVEGFLRDIVERKSTALGREKNILQKGFTGTVVTTKYFRYTIPSLHVHYKQNAPRVRRYLDRLTSSRKKG